jgi:hypothetical protein
MNPTGYVQVLQENFNGGTGGNYELKPQLRIRHGTNQRTPILSAEQRRDLSNLLRLRRPRKRPRATALAIARTANRFGEPYPVLNGDRKRMR